LTLTGIDQVKEQFDLDYIALKDCLFNFKELKPFPINDNDRKFTPFYLDFSWEELRADETEKYSGLKELAPNFSHFLETSICYEGLNASDYDTINVVQEMMGYYLIRTKKKTVAFFLVGNGANGKTILADILRSMFPPEYVVANSLEELTTDSTRMASLVGKALNIASEEESKKMKNDKFKAVVSGDPIQTRRLYEESFTFLSVCKFLFLTNKMPRFQSVDNGIKRRVEIINFPRDFEEEEQDRDLFEKIKKEMPIIVGWAINGAKRLVKNNYLFTRSDATIKAKTSFISDMSSSISFINEYYEVSNNKGKDGTKGSLIYNEYKAWMEEVGKKSYILGRDTFYDHIDRNITKGYKYGNVIYYNLIRNSVFSNQADYEDEIQINDVEFI
jgi:P4 family phage/plasmid primase-like protien